MASPPMAWLQCELNSVTATGRSLPVSSLMTLRRFCTMLFEVAASACSSAILAGILLAVFGKG